MVKKGTIAVVGMWYVELSIATLLAQYSKVYAINIILEKSLYGKSTKFIGSRLVFRINS